MGRLGQPAEEQIADNLRKILGVIEGWSHRRLQVETATTTERKQHDQEMLERVEDRRAKRNAEANPPADKAA